MKAAVLFLVTAALCVGSEYHKVPGCPAAIKYSRRGFESYIMYQVPVAVLNTSEKRIDAVDIRGELQNSFHEKKEFANACTYRDIGKNGRELGGCVTGILKGWPVKTWTVWLDRVAFEDGTTWSDDGSHRCSYTYDGKHN